MITSIFIVIFLILTSLITHLYRDHLKKSILDKKEIEKKILPIANSLLLFFFIGIIFINFSGFFKTQEEINEESKITSVENVTTDTTKIIVPERKLTIQEKYLSDNGFNIYSDLTETQFKEFKQTIETGLFKKESFCDVYKKALNLKGAELNRYLNKYKKIPYFETLLFMYGPKVCDMSSSIKESSSSYINSDESANPCIISEDFIKSDLKNPSTADFSYFDCSTEHNSDGSYTILRKVSSENSFGVEKEFIYKVKLGFKGGNWVDMNNWDLISIQSEEYR